MQLLLEADIECDGGCQFGVDGCTGYHHVEAVVEVSYRPERPAPFCDNPSDPRYSDSGDPEECDMEEVESITLDDTVDLTELDSDFLCSIGMLDDLAESARKAHEGAKRERVVDRYLVARDGWGER